MKFLSRREAGGLLRCEVSNRPRKTVILLILVCSALVHWLPLASAQTPDTNQLPNPQFRGSNGLIGVSNATLSGEIPTLWRAFAVDGADVTTEIVPLTADTLFPGSPATNAVQLAVNTFLGDTGFDHEQTLFPIIPTGRSLWGEMYLRSANSDNSPQVVQVSLPLFNSGGVIGNPGVFVATATEDWGYWGGFSFTDTQATLADMAFRLVESGSENSILIALPTVIGIPNLILADGFETPA